MKSLHLPFVQCLCALLFHLGYVAGPAGLCGGVVLSQGKPEKGLGGRCLCTWEGPFANSPGWRNSGGKKQNFRPTEEKIANSILLMWNGMVHCRCVISRVTLFSFLKN